MHRRRALHSRRRCHQCKQHPRPRRSQRTHCFRCTTRFRHNRRWNSTRGTARRRTCVAAVAGTARLLHGRPHRHRNTRRCHNLRSRSPCTPMDRTRDPGKCRSTGPHHHRPDLLDRNPHLQNTFSGTNHRHKPGPFRNRDPPCRASLHRRDPAISNSQRGGEQPMRRQRSRTQRWPSPASALGSIVPVCSRFHLFRPTCFRPLIMIRPSRLFQGREEMRIPCPERRAAPMAMHRFRESAFPPRCLSNHWCPRSRLSPRHRSGPAPTRDRIQTE